jgi:hypothetical protein
LSDIKKTQLNYWSPSDIDFHKRIELYGLFLEEVDFEYWQPCCYLDETSSEYEQKKQEMNYLSTNVLPNLTSDENILKKLRILWIMNRFTKYREEKWHEIIAEMEKLLESYIQLKSLKRIDYFPE